MGNPQAGHDVDNSFLLIFTNISIFAGQVKKNLENIGKIQILLVGLGWAGVAVFSGIGGLIPALTPQKHAQTTFERATAGSKLTAKEIGHTRLGRFLGPSGVAGGKKAAGGPASYIVTVHCG
jgi:hypothetical protein